MTPRIAITLCWGLLVCAIAHADLGEELRSTNESVLLDDRSELPDGGRVHQPSLVNAFYQSNGFQPAWSDRARVDEVMGLLQASELEGLNPADYHYPELLALIDEYQGGRSERDRLRARFELLLTDGFILYARHMIEGKVDPRQLDPSFNYSRRDFEPEELVRAVSGAIQARSLTRQLQAMTPAVPFYHQMKAALAHYRELALRSRFRPIPDDVVLKPGQSHPNVVPLRRRLVETGYLPANVTTSTSFDPALASSVRAFQRDHTLDVDGVVGARSFERLNLSYAERVAKLRINMDRLRWINQDISNEFIVVNIAGFELYYMRDGKAVWETPVMTGTVAHQTPIFTSRLSYLEFNPTWTVPRSIISRSLFPKFKANPQYVVDNDYLLYDREGVATSPHRIDWSAYNGQNFPYRVVQQPGDRNALGRVKFIFPNSHAVYLHDTPSRELFARSSRAFSSGCIRVKNPLELATVILDDPDRWSLQQVEAVVESRRPQQVVRLNRDVDVMLMYWTTSPASDGRVEFHPDIYGKDATALAALNAPPGGAGGVDDR